MQVSEVMTAQAECTRPDATLQEAARRMRDLDVGSLPVCGGDDRLAGMLTDRDITIRAVAGGLDTTMARVEQAMTREVIQSAWSFCSPAIRSWRRTGERTRSGFVSSTRGQFTS